ncbi:MAG: hypothetical protein KAW46_07095 [candidate division Zixibacteria bacterium]|nr:hypothetical protein [candidate division Zixibacteria bacterium]
MNQDIERMDHLMGTTPEERINAIERSKEENGRRRGSRALKEKAEEEQKKARKKRMADSLTLCDEESSGPDSEEPSQDETIDETDSPDDQEDLNNSAPEGHVDLKA